MERAININRVVWMAIFFGVAGLIAWREFDTEWMPTMGWFLAAGVWGAVCGIGYSVTDWIVREYWAARSKREEDSR